MRIRIITFTLSIAILLGASLPFYARTYYVSVRGNDQAQGSLENPYRSIMRAAAMAMPGDTVFVMEGVYRERVAPPRGGKEGKPIVYLGEPGKNVFIY